MLRSGRRFTAILLGSVLLSLVGVFPFAARAQRSSIGPHMGSVTYRVLCLAPGLVLSVPPRRKVQRTRLPSPDNLTASV